MKQTFLLLVAALTVVTCGKSDDSNSSEGGNISVGNSHLQSGFKALGQLLTNNMVMPLKLKIFVR